MSASRLARLVLLGAGLPALCAFSGQDASDADVRVEWHTRASALARLAPFVPLFTAVDVPPDAEDRAPWLVRWAELDALRRASAIAPVAALDPAALEAAAAARGELWAAALASAEFAGPDEAVRVFGAAFAAPYSGVREAALGTFARALYRWPVLRSTPLLPASGVPAETAEGVARVRAAAGLAGGAVPLWLAVERAAGRDLDTALDAAFEHVVGAPLDALAVRDLRASAEGSAVPTRALVEALALAAHAQGIEGVPAVDVDRLAAGFAGSDTAIRAGLEDELLRALSRSDETTGEGNVVPPEWRRSVGRALFARAAASADERLLRLATRVLPLRDALELGLDLPPESQGELQRALIDAAGEGTEPLPVDAFTPWLQSDLAPAARAAALELARRRLVHRGEVALGPLLTRTLAGDAWALARSDESLETIAALGRSAALAGAADEIGRLLDTAPEAFGHELLARLRPSAALAPLRPRLIAMLRFAPPASPPRNAIELLGGFAGDDAAADALVGVVSRATDVLLAHAAVDDVSGVEGAEGLARQAAAALLAVEGDAAITFLLDIVESVAGGTESTADEARLDLVKDVLEAVGKRGASADALVRFLAEGMPDPVRVRAAEGLLRSMDGRAAAERDPALVGAAAEVLLDALERGEERGRESALLDALRAVPAEHPSAAALRLYAARELPRSEPLLATNLAALAAGLGDLTALFATSDPVLAEPLLGDAQLERARAALLAVPRAAREAGSEVHVLEALGQRRVDLAGADADFDEAYAKDILRGALLIASVDLARSPKIGRDAALDEVAALFDVSLVRAERATAARLAGDLFGAQFASDAPGIAAFGALGRWRGRGDVQRASLELRPEILVRLDARELAALAEGAASAEVEVALWVAAEVARAGERAAADATVIEARIAVGLLRAAARLMDAGGERGAEAEALLRRFLVELLARLWTGDLSSRAVGLRLNDESVRGPRDAEIRIAAAAWALHRGEDELSRWLAAAFERLDGER